MSTFQIDADHPLAKGMECSPYVGGEPVDCASKRHRYMMEFRGLKALEELVRAAKAVHVYYAPADGETERQRHERMKQHRLGSAIATVERLFGIQ